MKASIVGECKKCGAPIFGVDPREVDIPPLSTGRSYDGSPLWPRHRVTVSDPYQVVWKLGGLLMLRPLNDRVVIVTEEDPDEPQKTKGGVYMPVSNQKERKDRGVVIATGPGKMNNAGVLVPTGVKPDDLVIFSKYGGMDLELDGQKYIVVGADDIVCVVEEPLDNITSEASGENKHSEYTGGDSETAEADA